MNGNITRRNFLKLLGGTALSTVLIKNITKEKSNDAITGWDFAHLRGDQTVAYVLSWDGEKSKIKLLSARDFYV